MTQVFNTAQEARQWMVAHPMREVEFTWPYLFQPGCQYGETKRRHRWNPDLFDFQWSTPNQSGWSNLSDRGEDEDCRYTVIDPEPTPDEWEEVLVPKDGRFHVGPPHFFQSLDGVFQARNERYALECILTHASEVKIEWPEWLDFKTDPGINETVLSLSIPCAFLTDYQLIFFALQIGAKVSIKRREGV